jgi:hypothetical protein
MFLAAPAVITALAMGCATAALGTDRSTSGIRAAEEVGAHQVPQAALHLQLAKEELQMAQSLNDDGEHEMAKSMLTRSEADAELAVLLSREDSERAEAKAAIESVHELRAQNKASAQ